MTAIRTGSLSLRGGWISVGLAAMAVVAVQAYPAPVFAQTNGTWSSAGVSDWTTPARWTGGVVAGGTNATATFTTTGTASLLTNIVLGNLSTGSGRVQLRSGTETTNANLTNESVEFATTTGTAPTITNTGRVDMFAVIAGTQGFTKSGAGALYINRPSNYTGVTTISAGDVRLGIGAGLGDSTTGNGTVVASGAMVRLDIAATTSYVPSVQTPEPFSIAGTGVSNLGVLRSQAGDNAFTGPITLSADAAIACNSSNAALTLSGAIQLGSNTLTLIDSGPFVVSGGIAGTGNLAYSGVGGLTLSGSSTFSGTTTIGGNTAPVAMTGYLAGPMVFNASARSLIGTGTFAGGLRVGSSNVLSPGPTGTAAADSYGTITASTLEVQSATVLLGIQDSAIYDRIVITAGSGGLTLGGTATLALDFAAELPTSALSLLSFTGLTGSFDGVSSTGAYAGTWTNDGGVWTLANVGTGGLQTLTYNQATGAMAVVPEPSTLVLLGASGVAAGLALGRCRSRPRSL